MKQQYKMTQKLFRHIHIDAKKITNPPRDNRSSGVPSLAMTDPHGLAVARRREESNDDWQQLKKGS